MNAPVSPPVQTFDATGATPVMQQFFDMKTRQPDALLFFRMGDFYELFFDDAIRAAAALGISQTFRGTHAGQPIPMAGVPHHAAEAYLSKLIRMGFKVAVCEQMEDPAEAKKRGSKSVVRRDIVRVVTPGTLTEDGLLDARGANRLAAVAIRAGQAAVAAVELSTGEVECFSTGKDGVGPLLAALSPSETLVADRLLADDHLAQTLKICGGLIQPMPSALSEPQASETRVKRLYGVDTLDGFGGLAPAEVGALGLIAAHLEMTRPASCRPCARRAGRPRPTSCRSTRPPAPAWRSTAPRAATATARCWRPSTAPSRQAAHGCWPRAWPVPCWTRPPSTSAWTPSNGSSSTAAFANACASS
jgi:DNA mismatch repair protein MutS